MNALRAGFNQEAAWENETLGIGDTLAATSAEFVLGASAGNRWAIQRHTGEVEAAPFANAQQYLDQVVAAAQLEATQCEPSFQKANAQNPEYKFSRGLVIDGFLSGVLRVAGELSFGLDPMKPLPIRTIE